MLLLLKSTKKKGLKPPYCGTSVFRKTSTALQLAIQFTLGCKLKDKIYTRWVMEVTIETEDVGVPAGTNAVECLRNPDNHPTDV